MSATRRGVTSTAILTVLRAREPAEVSVIELQQATGCSEQSVRHAVNRLQATGQVTTRMASTTVTIGGQHPRDFEPCLWGPEGAGEKPNRKVCSRCALGHPRYVAEAQEGRLTLPREWVPSDTHPNPDLRGSRLRNRLKAALDEGTFGVHVTLVAEARNVRTRLVAVGTPLTNGQA